MYRYRIPVQYICEFILSVYTYIDADRYILCEQLCTYLVRIIRTNMYNTEYVQTSTYSFVFVHICTKMYLSIHLQRCTKIRTFYMLNGVRMLYVKYVKYGIRTIRNK